MGNKCDKCGAEMIKLFSSMACPNDCDKICVDDVNDQTKHDILTGKANKVKNKLLRELANYNTFADHHKKCYACQSEDLQFKRFRCKQAVECGNCGIRAAARPTEEEALQSWQEICDRSRYPWYKVTYKTVNDAEYEATKEMLRAGFEKGLISANTFMSELEKLFARNNRRIMDEQGLLMKEAAELFVPKSEQDIDISSLAGPGKIIYAEPSHFTYISPQDAMPPVTAEQIEALQEKLIDVANQGFVEECCQGVARPDRQISDIFYFANEPDPKANEEYLIGDACFTFQGRLVKEYRDHFFGIHVWDTPKLHEVHGDELINCILKHNFYPPGTWTDGVPEKDLTEVIYPPTLRKGDTYHGHLFIKRDGSVIVKFINLEACGPDVTLPAWKDSE